MRCLFSPNTMCPSPGVLGGVFQFSRIYGEPGKSPGAPSPASRPFQREFPPPALGALPGVCGSGARSAERSKDRNGNTAWKRENSRE